ncbi:phage shock protein PspA [Rhodospirillum rubrum]|uniref:phage shock protein PspA n=1 Tax=Rhodospirillum rubrum TaxID=1085 RepID=UPI0019052BE2|nr:phage shock protein PspA [Rhodospirillum rubrum]MBK1665642.1 phage shock protein PspA [Rhodospirillum rubrum]MBK1678474.1 phage shock protein PspA [Rhodospirillum rubrum]
MGIFSRLTDIVNANLNALIDRAEDPEKMARLMIQEMEDTLVEVRTATVRTIADRKDLERSLERLEAGGREWGEKAEFALAKGREDLAKAALIAKRKLADQAEGARTELKAIDESLAKTNVDLGQLQAKLEEAKAKRKSLEIRMRSAQKRVDLRRTLHDGRIDEALGRYDSLERRISELEADADSYDLGKTAGVSLDEQFSELRAEADVEDELARLKETVARRSAGA